MDAYVRAASLSDVSVRPTRRQTVKLLLDWSVVRFALRRLSGCDALLLRCDARR